MQPPTRQKINAPVSPHFIPLERQFSRAQAASYQFERQLSPQHPVSEEELLARPGKVNGQAGAVRSLTCSPRTHAEQQQHLHVHMQQQQQQKEVLGAGVPMCLVASVWCDCLHSYRALQNSICVAMCCVPCFFRWRRSEYKFTL
jgi:hypothetical protein